MIAVFPGSVKGFMELSASLLVQSHVKRFPVK
jgi:hypothetical protein